MCVRSGGPTNGFEGTQSSKFYSCSYPSTFVWGFHGKNDTIVPFEETVRNIDMLPRHLARLTLYDDLAHDTTFSTVVLDINIYNWMLSKKSQTVANQKMLE